MTSSTTTAIFGKDDLTEKKKKKRKSRAQVFPGRALSFYEVIEMIRTRYQEEKRHPSAKMVFWGRPMSIFRVAHRPFRTVMEGAMDGSIHEVIYPPNYKCRCDVCKIYDTKKPRGPRRQADGSILAKHFNHYRGGLSGPELSKLRWLVVDDKGNRYFRFDKESVE